MPAAVIMPRSSWARGSPISTSSSWKGPSFDPTTAAVTFMRVLCSKAGLSRSRGLPDDLRVGLVLLKLLQSTQAVQPAKATLSEAAFLELVGDEGPGVGPHRAGAQLPSDPPRPADVAGPDRRPHTLFRAFANRHRPALAMTRLAVMQNCPLNVGTALVRTGMTTSRSASSKTSIGVLPPSSRDSRFSVTAASAMIWRPTRVLPV